MTSNELRRRILKPLYELYLDSGNGSLGASKLKSASGADDEVQFWEEVRYLHDEGYIDGTPVPFERQGYLERAHITQKGVHVMDNPDELDRLFPVDPVHLVVDEFLRQVRLEFERAEMDDDEKEQFFLYLERLSANPQAAEILYNVLNRCFLPRQ